MKKIVSLLNYFFRRQIRHSPVFMFDNICYWRLAQQLRSVIAVVVFDPAKPPSFPNGLPDWSQMVGRPRWRPITEQDLELEAAELYDLFADT